MAESESGGEKTEAPTPRRREEARDNGQIARSQDMTAAAMMLAAVLLISNFGENVMKVMKELLFHWLGPAGLTTGMPDPFTIMLQLFVRVAVALSPILIGLLLTAVVMNVIQVGFFLNFEKVMPNLMALNPVKGLGKIFGKGQGVVSLLMNLAKMTMIALCAYSAISGKMAAIVGATQLDVGQVFGIGATVLHDIALRIAVLLLILSVIDFAYQKYKITQELKMTKQEVKEEAKRMDGDPVIKQRRRQIAQQRAMKRVKQAVPTADVIVTNPTHYAVALKYEAGAMHAPKVVAKGADFLALKIREIAAEHGVPILERPPLARALYRTTEVGQEIPEEYYNAVAEIMAYVFEISGRAKELMTN